ncbi:MAG TPA: hypothetical protein K8V84_10805 [Nocardiopsis listeri]|uniref:hypothetical protein n=1 Tax=Nocardiopsis listeri TaxID=53440 RepID=UPI001DBAA56D|nr:hypothetical protein [Nocardiopsis listeri]HJE58979.1 hypothetical protein [Nocardiopsis listeri]
MTLPGADELFFRPSGPEPEQPETDRQHQVPEQTRQEADEGSSKRTVRRANGSDDAGRSKKTGRGSVRKAPKPSGRQRHDEKITVYVSGPELLALEQTRLSLRAEHGLSADRGRLVREAVAVLLADFEEHGSSSMLVRRLSED